MFRLFLFVVEQELQLYRMKTVKRSEICRMHTMYTTTKKCPPRPLPCCFDIKNQRHSQKTACDLYVVTLGCLAVESPTIRSNTAVFFLYSISKRNFVAIEVKKNFAVKKDLFCVGKQKTCAQNTTSIRIDHYSHFLLTKQCFLNSCFKPFSHFEKLLFEVVVLHTKQHFLVTLFCMSTQNTLRRFKTLFRGTLSLSTVLPRFPRALRVGVPFSSSLTVNCTISPPAISIFLFLLRAVNPLDYEEGCMTALRKNSIYIWFLSLFITLPFLSLPMVKTFA